MRQLSRRAAVGFELLVLRPSVASVTGVPAQLPHSSPSEARGRKTGLTCRGNQPLQKTAKAIPGQVEPSVSFCFHIMPWPLAKFNAATLKPDIAIAVIMTTA